MIERFAALAFPEGAQLPELPWPSLQADQENLTKVLTKLHVPMTGRPILGLCPGAEFGSAKRRHLRQHTQRQCASNRAAGHQKENIRINKMLISCHTIYGFFKACVNNLRGQLTHARRIDVTLHV
jgi:hypothetical protein